MEYYTNDGRCCVTQYYATFMTPFLAFLLIFLALSSIALGQRKSYMITSKTLRRLIPVNRATTPPEIHATTYENMQFFFFCMFTQIGKLVNKGDPWLLGDSGCKGGRDVYTDMMLARKFLAKAGHLSLYGL